MPFPIDITFRDMPPSPAVETLVRRWSERLAHVYDRIQRCSVVIGRPHQHQRHGQRFDVHVELVTPGRLIVATREPGGDVGHENAYVAIADAFRAVRRQLQDHARIQRGDVKHSA